MKNIVDELIRKSNHYACLAARGPIFETGLSGSFGGNYGEFAGGSVQLTKYTDTWAGLSFRPTED